MKKVHPSGVSSKVYDLLVIQVSVPSTILAVHDTLQERVFRLMKLGLIHVSLGQVKLQIYFTR